MKREIILFLILISFVIGCAKSNQNEDILGGWVSSRNSSPAFIFFQDSVLAIFRDTIKHYTYKIENNELRINGLTDKGIDRIMNERYSIQKFNEDTLVLSYESPFAGLVDDSWNVELTEFYRKVNFHNQRFDKIQFSYFNGWQTYKYVEVDSIGNFKAWEQNYWTKKTYQLSGKLIGTDMVRLLWGSNYLYDLPTSYKFIGTGCDDCPSYGLSFYRDGKIKSFYSNQGKMPSGSSFITFTLLNVIGKSKKVEVEFIKPQLLRKDYMSKDTIVIEK